VTKRRKRLLDFEIDKLTNSIENVISGESFARDILPVTKDFTRSITKKNGWLFDWKKEIAVPSKRVYKLVTVGNPDIIQGLMSIQIESGYVAVVLIESAPFNRGKAKMYFGVMGNLVAFACKTSFESNGTGYVSFFAKTRLIQHYIKALGAAHEGGQLMVIYPKQSSLLVRKYFGNLGEDES